MSTVFDDDAARYVVLRNDEGQCSLWPGYLPVPAGWQVERGPAGRADCLDHVERHWRDLRPTSLVATGDGANQEGIRS